jgi:hypothetical protein
MFFGNTDFPEKFFTKSNIGNNLKRNKKIKTSEILIGNIGSMNSWLNEKKLADSTSTKEVKSRFVPHGNVNEFLIWRQDSFLVVWSAFMQQGQSIIVASKPGIVGKNSNHRIHFQNMKFS